MMRQQDGIRKVVDIATAALADAGIGSARVDAEQLAAHVAGVDRGRLSIIDPPDGFFERYDALIDARSRRIPLQHLIGTAPFGPLLLDVGPGVFIPRPETEALLEWAVNELGRLKLRAPLIIDMCTGSAALAVALAHHWPSASVFGIDDSAEALSYARRNCAGTGVELIEADVADADLLPELVCRADLVVANPPYIPDAAELDVEVSQHDPHHALFGGPDGMVVIKAVVDQAVRWLRPGGLFAVEHDDTTSALTVDLIAQTGRFHNISPRTDLAGRPRFVTAVRSDQESDGQQ